MLLTPQQLEQAAKDVVEFWDTSELPDADKAKILEMVKDYYVDKDDHVFERYFAELCARTIDRRVPKTHFERND
jgi:hypothetical protein